MSEKTINRIIEKTINEGVRLLLEMQEQVKRELAKKENAPEQEPVSEIDKLTSQIVKDFIHRFPQHETERKVTALKKWLNSYFASHPEQSHMDKGADLKELVKFSHRMFSNKGLTDFIQFVETVFEDAHTVFDYGKDKEDGEPEKNQAKNPEVEEEPLVEQHPPSSAAIEKMMFDALTFYGYSIVASNENRWVTVSSGQEAVALIEVVEVSGVTQFMIHSPYPELEELLKTADLKVANLRTKMEDALKQDKPDAIIHELSTSILEAVNESTVLKKRLTTQTDRLSDLVYLINTLLTPSNGVH